MMDNNKKSILKE